MSSLPVGFPQGPRYSTSPPSYPPSYPPANTPVNTSVSHTPSSLGKIPAVIRSIAQDNENKRLKLNEDNSDDQTTRSNQTSSKTPVDLNSNGNNLDDDDDPLQNALDSLYDNDLDIKGFVSSLSLEEISVFEEVWLKEILQSFIDDGPSTDPYIVQLLLFPNPTNKKTVMHTPDLISAAIPALEYLLDTGKVDDFMKLISIQDGSKDGNTSMHYREILNAIYPLLKHTNVTIQNVTDLIDLENNNKETPGKDSITGKSLETLLIFKLDQVLK